MLKETLGSKFEVCSIFKPNAPLAEDLGQPGKGLTEQDDIVILEGPGNSLVMEYRSISASLQRG
jgi:hypothetical protein